MQFNGGIKVEFIIKSNCSLFLFFCSSIAKYSDPSFAIDPRSRSYHAYREWQRLSSLKDAESIPMRDSSKRRDQEK